jgi:peptidoglycan/LPS O-acetylase OafA/YrhL
MGIGIIWIMLLHGYQVGLTFSGERILQYIDTFTSFGSTGVDIFLFVSGIGLYYSYSKEQDTIAFFKKRALRIFPSYFLIVTVYWIWTDFVMQERMRSSFFLDLTQISLWTDGILHTRLLYVALIVPLYIVYPIFHKTIYGGRLRSKSKVSGKRMTLVGLGWIVAVIVANYILMTLVPDWYNPRAIALARIPIFIFGILCGRKVASAKDVSYTESGCLLVAACVLVSIFSVDTVRLILYLSYGIFAVVVCSAISLSLESVKTRCFFTPISRFLSLAGKYSFELYISHMCLRRLFVAYGMKEYFTEHFGDRHIILMYSSVIIAAVLVTAIAVRILKFSKVMSKVYGKKVEQK